MPRIVLFLVILSTTGCGSAAAPPELVWGRKGVRDGDFVRPRACVLDDQERLWIVDFTARVQAYDLDGNHLGLTWATPDYRKGRPSGLGLDRQGHLIVCDSHYGCLRFYKADGTLTRTIDGSFAYVSDVVEDDQNHLYLSEFGEVHRISKIDSSGKLLARWGSEGHAPGQFVRPRALALGPDGLLYVADSCNHRIQVFTRDGLLVRHWGTPGDAPGELRYPYDLTFGPDGLLHVVEYGNHRVQRFTLTGESRGTWGGPGREPGRFHSPWGLVVDRQGRVHVLDTENHRVQRLRF